MLVTHAGMPNFINKAQNFFSPVSKLEIVTLASPHFSLEYHLSPILIMHQ